MKTKLILLVCISFTLASCKKEATQPAQLQSSAISTDEQVADLIRKADKNLYNELYNRNSSRAALPVVHIRHGVFVPQYGDIASGYCMSHPTNPCFITITFNNTFESTIGGQDNTDANVTQVYSEEDHARLILNTPSPVVRNITKLSTTAQPNGNLFITYQ